MANSIKVYDRAYLATALQEFLAGTIWDQVIMRRGQAVSITNTPVRSATVSFIINNTNDGSTAVLPATGSAATAADLTQRSVDITLNEYGEGVITINANESLTSVTDVLMDAVRTQSRAASIAVDKLVANAAISMPIGAWVQGGKNWDTLTDELVHLGSATTTKAARTDVTSSDTLTADMLRLAYAKLTKRGVPKFTDSLGNQYYVAIVHPNVAFDLKKQAAAGSWQDAGRFIDGAVGIKYGVIGVYEGFLILESSHGTDLGAVGADTDADTIGQILYRSYFFGPDYLAKGFAPQELLPLADPSAEIMPLTESVQIRVLPSGDSHGRHKNVVWYAFLGYDFLMPDAGIAIETASSLDPVD